MQQFSTIAILEQICQTKLKKLEQKGMNLGYDMPNAREFPIIKPALLNDTTQPLIIAEIKRNSPAKGHISTITNPTQLAQTYLTQGANAISVLCEEDYFHGSLLDLYAVKKALPNACILRKDFIIHKDEVAVSYYFGADMVLLIAALFMDKKQEFCEIYEELLAYNLTPLIEIHNLEEWRLICDMDLSRAIVGINTRNLKTFVINKMDAMKLRAQMPSDIAVLFESGIQSYYDGYMAGASGFQGILCGSFLVQNLDTDSKQDSPKAQTLEALINSFCFGAQKPIFATLLRRFHAKNAKRNDDFKRKSNESTSIPLVKVCGINNLEFLQASFSHADLLGFILTQRSARYVDKAFLRKAGEIYGAHFAAQGQYMPLRVGVVTKECVEYGMECLAEGLIDCLQFHDIPLSFFAENSNLESGSNESESYGAYPLESFINVSEMGAFPCYFGVNSLNLMANYMPNPMNQATTNTPPITLAQKRQPQAHFALWDSSGGRGMDIDCTQIQTFVQEYPILRGNLWLAGGIAKENLAAIIELSPMLIDICSGFEDSPGHKSIAKLNDFMECLGNLCE